MWVMQCRHTSAMSLKTSELQSEEKLGDYRSEGKRSRVREEAAGLLFSQRDHDNLKIREASF